jgi:fibro-slime domain-containing protein
MREKAKQRVSLILVVTIVLGTVLTGNTVFATGESSDEQDRIKINISKDSEQSVEQNVAQTIHVTAQGQCSQSVCLNVYLKNEDGSAATDIDAVNLLTNDQLTDKNTQKTIDETLKDSVTLNDGTKTSPKAEWKNDKDENGTVTSKYLQITMPTDAIAINFDMQLQYRTDEASYTKKVLVEAKAFEEQQDITEAAKRADESKENEATVVWEGQAVSQSESEAADENTDGENGVNAVAENGSYTIYFQASSINDPNWDNATQIYVYGFDDSTNSGFLEMTKTNNVWKRTFEKQWPSVIFLTQNKWSNSLQTVDLSVNWTYTSPCFCLTGERDENTKKKKAKQTDYSGTTQPADGITVYYDATLSKLSYDKTENVKNGGKGIPYSENDPIYFYAKGDSKPLEGTMEKASEGTYKDVYKVTLPKGYTKIRFAAYVVNDENVAENGDATDLVEIPEKMTKPCYYGDSSDDIIYQDTQGNRGGYWGEAYTVRNAEAGKNTTVVDVPKGEETRDADKLYVNTTIYDYYSDYELNGKNRDNYLKQKNVTNHRIYQPFRQFNMALSDYYQDNQARSPLYWGNFQNFDGSMFKEIAGTMNLFGYDKDKTDLYKKFFYENNSMWGRYGENLTISDKLSLNGRNATQGLVADHLSSNNLQLKTENEKTITAPFFDKDFLSGKNSKNTVLGKVYENVTFPFVKKSMTSSRKSSGGTVDYWCFDSADQSLANKNLQLQYDETDEYFLQSTAKDVKGRTTDGETSNGNYFPLNSSDQSGDASELNYGFGQKFDLKFRLTSDGTVVDSENKKVPIEFNFSGDDDVWVFIDGKLVLDVGGDHDVVEGTINFVNKTATVNRVKNSNSNSGGASGVNTNVVKDFSTILSSADYFTKEHTLTMFYMERGLWESNMKVSFNFPDENEFAVEKKVDTTDVNTDLFPTKLFEDASVFPFTIQNQATHYAPKATESSDAKQTKTYNDSFSAEKISKISSQNTFETVGSMDGQTNVVHWKARFDDAEGAYVKKRFGIIQPADGETFDASETNAFLQFKMYYDYSDIPGLASTYLELEDSSGKTIGGYLSGKTYGNSSLVQKQWNTIQVDLSKLQGNKRFDYSEIKYIKFNYNLERDIYLDDFIFIPSVVAAAKTGFVTQQQDIPDYGSATSGTLEYPEGAQYTLSKNDGSSKLYRIGSDGMFALADGETATFSDQFRRGSYIAVSEDVNSSVFDTTWTLYENGQAVSTMGTGNTVENENPIPSVKNVEGNIIRDGRKEVYKSGSNGDVAIANSGYTSTDYAKNQDSEKTENKNTIVFRSYVAPDNQTTMTKLKATFVNKVKTGKIEIRKETAEGSDPLTGEYTFRVEFSNVADLSLESKKIVKEYTIKAGESVTIDGIPAGTDYRISEIESTDGSTLESVIVENNNTFDAGYDPVTKVVSGRVIASSDMKDKAGATIITFKNTLKPTINLNLTKVWKNTDDILPASIKIQLQRSRDKGKNWETVKYDGTNETITLSQGYDGKWSYSFKDLDQYVNYRADQKVPYIYRVVEVSGDDENETVIEDDGYLNDKYKVTYSENVDCSKISTETPESKTQSFTITNTYSPKTNIKITKQDASTKELLNGAVFKLEKMKEDTSTRNLVVDDSFETEPVITGDSGSPLGIAEFKDLTDGTYRLTETKAAENHSLLKDPVIIVINRSDKCLIDNEECKVVDNTISITISNQARFDLPATGGYGRYIVILGGIALAGVGLFMYRLQKRRKEGNIS